MDLGLKKREKEPDLDWDAQEGFPDELALEWRSQG